MSGRSVIVGDDGMARCWWGSGPPDYCAYHDYEWGFGVTDDHRLFEKLCLEGFQAGLSWLTILRKRDRFREVFADFEPAAVARFDDGDIERLLGDAGIVRHEGKIGSTINNASRALEMIDEFGSIAAYFWPHADLGDAVPGEVPSSTDLSIWLSKDLKRRGWSFVGPTTMYAFMQAMGLVNDHLEDCWVRATAQRARVEAARPLDDSKTK